MFFKTFGAYPTISKMLFILILIHIVFKQTTFKSYCTVINNTIVLDEFNQVLVQDKGQSNLGQVNRIISNNLYIGHFLQGGRRVDIWNKQDLSHVVTVLMKDLQVLSNSLFFTDAELMVDSPYFMLAINDKEIYKVQFKNSNWLTGFFFPGPAIKNYKNFPNNPKDKDLFPKRLKGKKLEVTKNAAYVLTQENYIIRYRLNENNFNFDNNKLYELGSFGQIIGIKTCQYTQTNTASGIQDQSFQYFAVWSSENTLITYKCVNDQFEQQSCQQLSIKRDFTVTTLGSIIDINFNHNCEYIFYNKNQLVPIQEIDLQKNQNYNLAQVEILPTQSVQSVWYVDYEDTSFMLLKNNKQLVYYDYDRQNSNEVTLLQTYHLSQQYGFVHYDIGLEKLFLMNDKSIAVRKFLGCGQVNKKLSIGKCAVIDSSGTDLVNNSTDVPDTDADPVTNSTDVPDTDPVTNSTDVPDTDPVSNSTDVPDTDPVSNSTDVPDTDPTTNSTDVPDPDIDLIPSPQPQPNPEPNSQKKVGLSSTVQQLKQGIQSMSTVTKYATISLMVLPFSALFMKFISFWTVCSFYAFLQIGMPEFLEGIFKELFVVINSSLFDLVGIKVKVSLYLNDQKSNQKLIDSLVKDFKITSDFLTINYQGFIMFVFSMIILLVLFLISKIQIKANLNETSQTLSGRTLQSKYSFQGKLSIAKINDNQMFRKKSNFTEKPKHKNLLSLDMVQLIVGQFLSLMPAFFIGLFIVSSRQNGQRSFSQKINLSLVVLSIGVSFGYAFVVLAVMSQTKALKRRKIITKKYPQPLKQWKDTIKQDLKSNTKQKKLTFNPKIMVIQSQKMQMPQIKKNSCKENIFQNNHKIKSAVAFNAKSRKTVNNAKSILKIQKNQLNPPKEFPIFLNNTTFSIDPLSIKSLTTFYLIQLNTLIPFTAILGIVPLFIVVNFFVYGLGIICAIKEKYSSMFRKINSILLSTWLMLLHFFMTLLLFFNKDNYPQESYNLAVIITFILFVGAAHEVTTFLLIDIFYDCILVFLKFILSIVSVCSTSKVANLAEVDNVPQSNIFDIERNNENFNKTFMVITPQSKKSRKNISNTMAKISNTKQNITSIKSIDQMSLQHKKRTATNLKIKRQKIGRKLPVLEAREVKEHKKESILQVHLPKAQNHIKQDREQKQRQRTILWQKKSFWEKIIYQIKPKARLY